MHTLTLSDEEKAILSELLNDTIQRVEKVGGSPFYTAHVVNIYWRLENTNKTVPLVAHKAEVLPNVPEKPQTQAPVLKVGTPKEVVISGEPITPENIDLADDLLIDDVIDEREEVPAPQAKTAR